MQRTYIIDSINKTGENVLIKGWVDSRRDHGKLIFIDIIDATGILQTVFQMEEAKELRLNDVIEVEGKVAARPEKMINKDLETGKVELQAEKLTILNKAETTPFELNTDGYEVNEEVRLKYKYLDLRRARLQKNMRKRHQVFQFIRDFLTKENFVEIETPILTKSTPEGARDYVVPSRLQKGKFYALPQSPQQYKELLMVSGFEKYFQFPKCFRDEDTRGDRQPEFTQLDIEMSFVAREDVMALNEEMMIKIVEKLYPEKKIAQIPFPRLTYKEAMEKYKTDRPDIREDKNNPNELAFCWVIDFPFFAKATKGEPNTTHSDLSAKALASAEASAKEWTFTHNPFSGAMPEWQKDLMEKKNIDKIIAAQYDLALNGFEIGGGSIRNHRPEALKKVFEILGYEEKQIEENFGHMLSAFSFGAPPHGGIAYGMDRIVAILQNEPNIREVMAFPKTGDGRDLMMNSPSEITKEQLKELGISIGKEKK